MADQTTEQKKSYGITEQTATHASNDDSMNESQSAYIFSQVHQRTVIIAVVLVIIVILCLVFSTGFSHTGTRLKTTDKNEIFQLRQQVQVAQANLESLPDLTTATRSLVLAQKAAHEVAVLQNNYRFLAGSTMAKGGVLDVERTVDIRRDLTPYFDRGTNIALLYPWYLLASDAAVPIGTGIPELFESSFSWYAQQTLMVNDNGTIPVTWLAYYTEDAGKPNSPALAWAQADYDIVRQVFINPRVGVTELGTSVGLEVKN